jgi:hypothetical protein
MTMDSTYAAVLTWTFIVSNAARLFAYLPTISRLAQPGCTGDGHSELTWLLWTVSNATLTLQLFEQLQRQVDATVLLSLGNVLMNLIVLSMVRQAHRRTRSSDAASASREPIESIPNGGVVPRRT